jgi:hypothetical protein
VLTSRDIGRSSAALPPRRCGAAAPVRPRLRHPRADPEYTLTDARKLELFLRYINRLIDFLFRP